MAKIKVEAKAEIERRFYGADRAAIWRNPPVMAALAAHDRLYAEIEGKFGIDVLQTLVSPELAAKFANAINKRDAAIETGTEDEIIARLGSVCRGIEALKAEAEAKGYTSGLNGKRWRTTADDGTRWVFVQTIEDARAAAAMPEYKGFQIWSIPEVIRMLQASSLVSVLKAKEAFPSAEIVSVRSKAEADSSFLNDEIPF